MSTPVRGGLTEVSLRCFNGGIRAKRFREGDMKDG